MMERFYYGIVFKPIRLINVLIKKKEIFKWRLFSYETIYGGSKFKSKTVSFLLVDLFTEDGFQINV